MLAWRWALLRHRVAAGVEHVGVLRQLDTVGIVVDVGANRGQFALAARHCFGEARIVAFEPLPGPADRFRRIFDGDAKAVLHPVAVGPQHKEETIHVTARDDSSSLLPITAMQCSLFPGTEEVRTAVIQLAPLPNFLSAGEIDAPALLKLDVQGYELEALKGCEALLDYFDYVYVECSFVELYAGQVLADEVVAWLRERDLLLNGVHNLTYDRNGRAVQGDFLFTRR